MTEFLVRTLTDSTGHTFIHITQARENETFVVVEAESKEEAERKYKAEKLNEAFTKSKKGQWMNGRFNNRGNVHCYCHLLHRL